MEGESFNCRRFLVRALLGVNFVIWGESPSVGKGGAQ
jgi:hypothetical protein